MDEAILIRGAGKIIMSKVDDILSTLETKVKIGSCLSLVLLKFNACGERSLPGIHRLSVGSVVKESHLRVATLADEARDNTTSNGI